ncbi:MAG: Hsp20/alpha crystallin family protein, partial [Thermoleophilaceae bacterium]
QEDVDISFDHDTLTISGERTGAPEEDTTYYVRERHYGSFRRTINLPEGTDRGSVAAALEDGLLEITVVGGCATRREPEHIEIQVGGGERG